MDQSSKSVIKNKKTDASSLLINCFRSNTHNLMHMQSTNHLGENILADMVCQTASAAPHPTAKVNITG